MKLRYRLKTFLQFFAFAFYPKVTIFVCLSVGVLIDIAVALILRNIAQESLAYDVLLALLTGVTASFIVAIIVELANNYRHNKLAWHELHEYYSAIEHYEIFKQVLMRHTLSQRVREQVRRDAGLAVDDSDDRSRDLIQATWELLPDTMPVLKDTLEKKKLFLTNKEIDELKNIVLFEYKAIRHEIQIILMLSPIMHSAMNHPDEQCLGYPQNILDDLPDWIKEHLARNKSRMAIEIIADEIMADQLLLTEFMKGYDISQACLDNYMDPYSKNETEEQDSEFEDYAFHESEEEEEFQALHNEQNRILVEQRIPFVSWHISQSCKKIAESINILEREILKKPYYSISLKFNKDSEKRTSGDPLYDYLYEREKRQK